MIESSITSKVLESLLNPVAYPVQTCSVELLQTHVSWLLLTDTHVFKLKKPVNLGFLDFSTPNLRQFYCTEELRLNRRLCPDIYEQVIELRTTESGAAFIGDGTVIDYAVMMKRLPSDRMLDKLINDGKVSTEEIRIVAETISRFHSTSPTSRHISRFGALTQILFNWQENFAQTTQFKNSTLPQSIHDTINSYVTNFTLEHCDLFKERVKNGFIRDCDGDIHLGNICLIRDTAYIFDCIEFNERFRFSDTAADLAFLLMDLDFHHRPDLSEEALRTYITLSGDSGIMKLIPFYKIYRAFVRGKVESFQLLDVGISQNERTLAQARAISYFRLARGYCLQSRLPPTLFITCGTMGCGKSTLAAQLAFELNLTTFSSDTIRKQRAGLTTQTAVHVPFEAGLYRKEVSLAIYNKLKHCAAKELATGHSVLVDAGFMSAALRTEFASLAASYNAEFVILFVQCDTATQRQRLRERMLHGSSISDGREELLDQQTSVFELPAESEGTIISVSTNTTMEQSMNTVYRRLFNI